MQATSTGHDPGVVRVLTVHDQETLPALSAVFGPRPCAVLGPDEYVTVIVQLELADVVATAVAVLPRATGLVTDSATECGGTGAAVGATVGAIVDGACVGEEVRTGVGATVGA